MSLLAAELYPLKKIFFMALFMTIMAMHTANPYFSEVSVSITTLM